MSDISRKANVGWRLNEVAATNPHGIAVVEQLGCDAAGNWSYRQTTFRELSHDTDRVAAGLRQWGVQPGMRLVLLVRPGIDFIALVFALFKAGAVVVLIDPGMGKRHLIGCLAELNPDGFIAIPAAQLARVLHRRQFPRARWNVTVGRRWGWGGTTLAALRSVTASPPAATDSAPDDPAAVIFTSGSTGPPKGVLYRHGNFARQVDEIRDYYRIQPGEVDVSCFPLFALFNAAMGVTTVVPQMDFTRPAEVAPAAIVAAARDQQASQAFGSPALWNRVGRYCESQPATMPSLRRVLSAGAPVPVHVLRRVKAAIHAEGEMHTPYGATEALPVASISASQILAGQDRAAGGGGGVCVGGRFPGIHWRVIPIDDGPLETIDQTMSLPRGEIGELMVSGDVVTTEYVTRTDQNALHKVQDGNRVWHRLGDVGYLDAADRFWFCGRKSQRVVMPELTLFTIPVEAVLNRHPQVYRSALVGLGERGSQQPVMVVEPWPEHWPRSARERQQLLAELWELALHEPATSCLHNILLRASLPVDIRHNSKIFREQLRDWAAVELRNGKPSP